MILGPNRPNQGRLGHPERLGGLEVELLGPADRGPTVVHTELGVDVLGVRAHGVQRHHELAGDIRPIQLGFQQPKNVALALAQWVDQPLLDAPAAHRRAAGGEETAGVLTVDALLCRATQEVDHWRALVEEESDVALGLGKRQCLFQRFKSSGDVSSILVGERLQGQDPDDASRPLSFFRCNQEAVQESSCLVDEVLRTLGQVSGHEHFGQRDVLVLE